LILEKKKQRQMIIVTHNANIPVNGDAEYIVSLKMENNNSNINENGCIDKQEIKQEICDIMEGSKNAFEMRSKRYL